MFDITSSKLLLLGIVALIVIGPKDLPVLLRTIGKYVGIIRKQAAEFRAQFEEAVRESELDQLKKDVENLGAEAEASRREAERTVTTELDAAKAEVEQAIRAGAAMFGINNRDLHTFEVDLSTAERIRPLLPRDAVVVGESGVHTRDDVQRLYEAGVHAVLVGEAFMTAPNVRAKMEELRL